MLLSAALFEKKDICFLETSLKNTEERRSFLMVTEKRGAVLHQMCQFFFKNVVLSFKIKIMILVELEQS